VSLHGSGRASLDAKLAADALVVVEEHFSSKGIEHEGIGRANNDASPAMRATGNVADDLLAKWLYGNPQTSQVANAFVVRSVLSLQLHDKQPLFARGDVSLEDVELEVKFLY
jgi:hypothetical protein